MTNEPDKPTHRRWQIPWAAMLVIAFVPTLAYVGSYLALSEYWPQPNNLNPEWRPHVPATRVLRQEWMVTVYRPLGAVESYVRGEPVFLQSRTSFYVGPVPPIEIELQ